MKTIFFKMNMNCKYLKQKLNRKLECYPKCPSQIYILGNNGLIGSTGPSSGLAAYGGRFSNTSQTITLGLGTQTQIPLPTTMPNLNTTYTTANSITVNQGGVYEINYYSNISAPLLQL